ncbi:hypothetical protein J8273_1030 [Carpediemonas membranifera]|uniref:Uncharacterized protein n=1 Tax=Carpediemonas membranifera TaxID=201153 RepID=A0A8J6BGP2_9EUKA|nr:hypothetical protein J8273_1030 [Carpediemonas membranifera]|eukprot:KAG9397122.1 hypothetical protein J8273_1030 [Carpediemonas membranifera]
METEIQIIPRDETKTTIDDLLKVITHIAEENNIPKKFEMRLTDPHLTESHSWKEFFKQLLTGHPAITVSLNSDGQFVSNPENAEVMALANEMNSHLCCAYHGPQATFSTVGTPRSQITQLISQHVAEIAELNEKLVAIAKSRKE